MTGEIFNPNPVVFTSSKALSQKRPDGRSLWLTDSLASDEDTDGSDDAEPIDQDEVFGG